MWVHNKRQKSCPLRFMLEIFNFDVSDLHREYQVSKHAFEVSPESLNIYNADSLYFFLYKNPYKGWRVNDLANEVLRDVIFFFIKNFLFYFYSVIASVVVTVIHFTAIIINILLMVTVIATLLSLQPSTDTAFYYCTFMLFEFYLRTGGSDGKNLFVVLTFEAEEHVHRYLIFWLFINWCHVGNIFIIIRSCRRLLFYFFFFGNFSSLYRCLQPSSSFIHLSPCELSWLMIGIPSTNINICSEMWRTFVIWIQASRIYSLEWSRLRRLFCVSKNFYCSIANNLWLAASWWYICLWLFVDTSKYFIIFFWCTHSGK